MRSLLESSHQINTKNSIHGFFNVKKEPSQVLFH